MPWNRALQAILMFDISKAFSIGSSGSGGLRREFQWMQTDFHLLDKMDCIRARFKNLNNLRSLHALLHIHKTGPDGHITLWNPLLAE